MSHNEPHEARNLRVGHSASPSPSPLIFFSRSTSSPPLIPSLSSIDLQSRLTQNSLAQSSSLYPFVKLFFMQPAPIAVSPNPPPVDSYPVNFHSTQHGHDLDDAQVSGSLSDETSILAEVSGMPTQDNRHTSLNDERSAPPSKGVSQHSNAGSNLRQPDYVGIRVNFAEESDATLETFPNGNYLVAPRCSCANYHALQRSSLIYCRICPLRLCLPSRWYRVGSMRL